jgi:hypothetical protein
LNYSIKLVEFSKTIYDDTGILVLSGKVSESSPNMTTTSGYIRDNLSLQALPVPMVTSAKPFDFMNSNFALFIKNNGTESINVSIS